MLGGLKDKDALKSYQVTHFTPFDPVHKRTEATVKGEDGKTFEVTKGAPQVILGLSTNAAAVKDAVDKAVNDFAARGFRALGVARADGDGKWQFLGLLPLFDPPREDAKATIATAAAMGVKIKKVTGDALAIAREMTKTLGMGSDILDGGELGDSKKEESAKAAKEIEEADGFRPRASRAARRASGGGPANRTESKAGQPRSPTGSVRPERRRLARKRQSNDGPGAQLANLPVGYPRSLR